MSKVIRVNSRMCRNARGLLKWNTRDLCIRAKIQLQRLMEFEHGQIQLLKSENEMIFHAFEHAGITFGEKGEISLTRFHTASADDDTTESEQAHKDTPATPISTFVPPPAPPPSYNYLSEEEKARQEWLRLYGPHWQPQHLPAAPDTSNKS
jgi:hypothetical protein